MATKRPITEFCHDTKRDWNFLRIEEDSLYKYAIRVGNIYTVVHIPVSKNGKSNPIQSVIDNNDGYTEKGYLGFPAQFEKALLKIGSQYLPFNDDFLSYKEYTRITKFSPDEHLDLLKDQWYNGVLQERKDKWMKTAMRQNPDLQFRVIEEEWIEEEIERISTYFNIFCEENPYYTSVRYKGEVLFPSRDINNKLYLKFLQERKTEMKSRVSGILDTGTGKVPASSDKKSSSKVDEPTKTFPEYILHETPEKLAKELRRSFFTEKGKGMHLMLKALSERSAFAFGKGEGKMLHGAMEEYFKRDIGTYQSIFDFVYIELKHIPDYEVVLQRVDFILTNVKKQQ